VSRARFAILLLLGAAGCHADLPDHPTPSPLRRVLTVEAAPPEAPCPDGVLHDVAPPAHLFAIESGQCEPSDLHCFRLREELRALARAAEPRATLSASAHAFERFDRTGAREDLEMALAMADLAVTGSTSYERLVRAPIEPSDLDADATSAQAAIERAHAVAWALHGPVAHRRAARRGLGWVTVSPEDDPPSDPVNVSQAPFPTTSITLEVQHGDARRTVRTRLGALATRAAQAMLAPIDPDRELPAPESIVLPDKGPIVLVLHGHSSTLEEAAPLAEALVAEALEMRRGDLAVVAVDLPSNGYAERLDPFDVLEGPNAFPSLLAFLDAFVASVVAWLEQHTPTPRHDSSWRAEASAATSRSAWPSRRARAVGLRTWSHGRPRRSTTRGPTRDLRWPRASVSTSTS
jgi:hypothetical protein